MPLAVGSLTPLEMHIFVTAPLGLMLQKNLKNKAPVLMCHRRIIYTPSKEFIMKLDQRSVHIYITKQGKELLAQAPSPPQGQLSNTLSKLTSEQLTNLENSLQVFTDALNFEDVKASTTPIPEDSK